MSQSHDTIATMKVRLLSFASALDAIGQAELELQLEPGTRVGGLKQLLNGSYPSLAGLWQRMAVAVDGQVCDDELELEDGAEVALLPPVSGGSVSAESAATVERVTERPLQPEALLQEVHGASRGAVLLFAGTVRNHHRGRSVDKITYTAYRSMAEERIRQIESELEAGHDDLRVAIAHRLGPLEVGAISVVIAVASPHREASYEANRAALERLKREVPIWKREHYADGDSVWREEEPL